ncbi:MAG: surface antigen [Firmicutes bacterium]|nr:surface antigen [Bacillota bacterium]
MKLIARIKKGSLATFLTVSIVVSAIAPVYAANPVATTDFIGNNIVFKGNTKVSNEKLQSLLKIDNNKAPTTETLREGAQAIEKYYHDQGYILARVSNVSPGDHGTIFITVNEGKLEDIVVKGNKKVKTNVITREIKVKRGEPFDSNKARRSMEKLYNLGYFEDVKMKLNAGVEPNSVVLEIDVKEQKTGTYSLGGSYSESDGMGGYVELGDTDFLGTGDKAKIGWNFGGDSKIKGYNFSYTMPWMDSKETSLTFNWYNMTNRYSDYGYNGDYSTLRSTYYKNVRGFDITMGRAQGEYVHNYLTFKNRRDTYVDYYSGPVNYATTTDSNYTSYLDDNFGLTRSVALSRVYDSRDNVFSPTKGTYFSTTAEFAGRGLGGDFNFDKYTVEDRNYFKVGHSQVIATRFIGGYADGNMPVSQKFSAGGSDSLRGYHDEQFTGNRLLAATTEYRFPLAKKVEGVLFGDIGNAWDGGSCKLNDLKSDVGFGVRLNTPLGPIRLDYAWGEYGGRTSFSFGGKF